jgi:hypothetical protein
VAHRKTSPGHGSAREVKAERASRTEGKTSIHEPLRRKSNDLFIEGAGTPNVIAMPFTRHANVSDPARVPVTVHGLGVMDPIALWS